jgi:hypothetical protein
MGAKSDQASVRGDLNADAYLVVLLVERIVAILRREPHVRAQVVPVQQPRDALVQAFPGCTSPGGVNSDTNVRLIVADDVDFFRDCPGQSPVRRKST